MRLPVDGSVLTGSAQSANWGAICYDLLGAILDIIYGGRIDMGWLRETLSVLRDDSTEVQRVRYARAYILQIIGGYLMLDKLRNLVHLRWLLKLIDFRAADELSWGSIVLATLLPLIATIMGSVSLSTFTSSSGPLVYIPTRNKVEQFTELRGIPTALEDIRLLLD
ncbi:hypothetical protein Golax_003397 [Gossypium laxum]|uniref:Aminotransferase-like plant mobile domain-containing protein n=1 Tax=Gossypium laxum TaxID=34288 RepID=A0A7J9AFA1_9ROSI|nr:hypothetical protein [Gossypium laxum]